MAGGPGAVWGVLVDVRDETVDYEIDEEGVHFSDDGYGFLQLDAEQTKMLYDALKTYYEIVKEEAL